MRLSLLGIWTMAAVLLWPAVGLALAVPPGKGAPKPSWQTSSAWRKYKAYWHDLSTLKTLKSVQAMAAQVQKLDLSKTFHDGDLRQSLHASLQERVDARMEAVQGSGDKAPTPDWKKELAASVAILGHQVGALTGLRKLDVGDPWIDQTLVPEINISCQFVESQVTSVEEEPAARAKGWGGGGKEEPLDAQTKTLVASARAEVLRARALIADPSLAR